MSSDKENFGAATTERGGEWEQAGEMFFPLVILKTFLFVFSFSACVLSLIFMLSVDLFRKIEEFLGLEFGRGVFVTALEGKINFVNDWIYDNRVFFGPLFALLAAINTRNAFFLF